MHANYRIIKKLPTLTRNKNMVKDWKSQRSQHEHVALTKIIKEGQIIIMKSVMENFDSLQKQE
jgi:hypothetical protein